MREIKFRAWDKQEKNIWHDVLDDLAENEYYDEEYSMTDLARAMKTGNEERFVFMQYTGIKDKNGKEIYEGDIVEGLWQYNVCHTGVVKFGLADSRYVSAVYYISFENGSGRGMSHYEYFTVIGNIYENPELTTE